jgi:hypothetical protein
MKRSKFIATILLFGFNLLIHCKGENVDFKDKNIFWDGLFGQSGISLFNLFDEFPALKNGLSKLQPEEFNFQLNRSLEPLGTSLPDSLTSLSSLFKENHNAIKVNFNFLSNELKYLRESNTNLFNRTTNVFEKIRISPGFLIPTLIPISNESLKALLQSKSEKDLSEDIEKIQSILIAPDFISFVESLEDIFSKLLLKNTNSRAGLTNIIYGIFQYKNPELINSIFETIGGIGDGFAQLAGSGTGFKSSGATIKELIINFESHFSENGSNFTSINSSMNHSTQLRFVIRDLLYHLRNVVITPPNLIDNSSNSLFDSIAVSYQELGFTSSLNRVNASFQEMMVLDFQGKNRTLDASSDSISLLEHLIFTLGVVNEFGYFWSNDPANPQIESASGGILTIGDSLFSMASKLGSIGVVVKNANATIGSRILFLDNQDSAILVGDKVLSLGIPSGSTVISTTSSSIEISSNTTASFQQTPITFKRSASISNLGVSAVLWNSSLSGRVKRDGQADTLSLNTPALSRVENNQIISRNNDPIYTKTIPWILANLSATLYSGQGPYYNPKRKNEFGQIITLDNRPYRDSEGNDLIFKQNWNTSRYKIAVRNANNNEIRYAGIGGSQYQSSDASYGSFYSIPEMPISENDRSVSSDEEAFYKNYLWFLNNKRFVLVLPVALEALGDSVQDAVYVVIVANGLKGLINVKPFCNASQCNENDSGRWNLANTQIKDNFKIEGNLQNFSNIAGDSVFLLEVWGYGISANESTNFGFVDDTTFQQVFRLLFSKFGNPNQFYGLIPPAISVQFSAIEKLGFLSNSNVNLQNIDQYWNQRNHLLPLVASFAKACVRTSNSTSNRNSFLILTDLIQVLNRPFIFDGIDQTAQGDTNDTAYPNRSITIRQFRIRGYAGSFGMRSPSMPSPSLYYPNINLRSPLSFLIENQRKWNDGILNALSKGSALNSLLKFLYYFGETNSESAKQQTVIGFQQLAYEFRLNSELPNSNQHSLDNFALDLELFIKRWVRTRGNNPNSASYASMDSLETFMANIVNNNSPHSYSQKLKSACLILKEANLKEGDIRDFLQWIGQIFETESGEKRRALSIFLSQKIPLLFSQMNGQLRPLLFTLESLTRSTFFMEYFYNKVRSDFTSKDIWQDWERFFSSRMIQMRSNDKNDLLFSISEICKLFSDVIRAPKKPMNTEYWFSDQVNRYNELTIFDRFNFIFSKK